MRPLSMLGLLVALAMALPAQAQNAGQIGRARAGGNCPGCNLFQADFGGLQMRARDFSHARLRQADLSLGVMNRASFAGADLRDVEAYGGVFTGADFRGANLTNASFVGAFLQSANFSGAILDGANFSGAQMSRVQGLSQVQLNRACGDPSTVLPPGLRIRPC